MELHALQVFATVVAEQSFSRAAEKLLRTQPAVSLALQRLEDGARGHADRPGAAKELVLTDAGPLVLDFARRFENLRGGAGRRAGRAARQLGRAAGHRRQRIVDAVPAAAHRALPASCYPKIKVQVRRSQSSRIPAELLEGDLELGVASYDPGDDRLVSKVIYTDALAFIVSPRHRFAAPQVRLDRRARRGDLHRPQRRLPLPRDVVLREFRRHKVPLNMDVEMPTLETIRKLVAEQRGGGLPAPHGASARTSRAAGPARDPRQRAARRAQGPAAVRRGPARSATPPAPSSNWCRETSSAVSPVFRLRWMARALILDRTLSKAPTSPAPEPPQRDSKDESTWAVRMAARRAHANWRPSREARRYGIQLRRFAGPAGLPRAAQSPAHRAPDRPARRPRHPVRGPEGGGRHDERREARPGGDHGRLRLSQPAVPG